MFERSTKPATHNDQDDAPYRGESLLTTDDILQRVRSRSRVPLKRLLLWGGLLLGLLAVLRISAAVIANERLEVARRMPRTLPVVAPAADSMLPSGSREAGLPTPISVKLSHVGAIYMDGRYLGLQKRLRVALTPGAHALLVRFGHRSVTQTLDVGTQAACVTCDKRLGCSPLKVSAAR